jgi:hypothetical protein
MEESKTANKCMYACVRVQPSIVIETIECGFGHSSKLLCISIYKADARK